jgi:twitching motility two-component system response regulator PilH
MDDDVHASHILVLDDTQEILAEFRAILTAAGYQVTTGEKLYDTVDDLVLIGPELLVLDFMWSGDRTGWDYLLALRDDPRTQSLPVILCTRDGPQLDALRRHFRTMNVSLVLKPFVPDELLTAIRQKLDLALL